MIFDAVLDDFIILFINIRKCSYKNIRVRKENLPLKMRWVCEDEEKGE